MKVEIGGDPGIVDLHTFERKLAEQRRERERRRGRRSRTDDDGPSGLFGRFHDP
jgi:hypothetical protein